MEGGHGMIISNVKLVDICLLKPHEHVDESDLKCLTEEINKHGFWHVPIIFDKESGVIMDGHHRYNFALISGFSKIPSYEMSYRSESGKGI
ncbi:hypothetical protein E0H95_26860 [Pseudomonas syringae pv. tomato]|nr:hypothetical protein [Pseudomonas syringae pv. tomato]PYD05090.1 hypothetical protein DND90_14665 [Pseudomonas syringae pv. maculicola]